MAKITFPRKEFEKEIKLTDEVREKISMLGTHLESVTDNEIEIEVLPNRPDLFSMQGFLRALKAFLGKETGLKKYRINAPEKDFKVKIDPSLKGIRSYTACAIIKGLKFDDAKIKEIIDIQEKLHATVGRKRKKAAIGIYPLEKITLPIKFEARAPKDIKFLPLEGDREMSGLEILQRHPTGREYAFLLEGLDKFPVFVDAKGKILSMPPIINSHETGKITEKTEAVFIECSGSDFNVLKKIINIIVTTLADMGGKVYQMELDYEKKELTPNLEPETMKLSLDNANKLLGLDLKEKDLEKLLPKMGYDYSKGNVKIPAWRTDILHEVDIIEDIAIAYGYDKIEPEIPKVATIGEESQESKIKSKISEILLGIGLLEISTYHLIKADEIKGRQNLLEVENSKTDYKYLRPSLIIPALRVLSENKDHEYPQKIFEIGSVFSPDARQETGVKETQNLLIASTPGNFTGSKQILDCLFKMLNIECKLKEFAHEYLIDGRAATVLIDNKPIGVIGEVHPETLRKWNIKLPLAIIEISLEEIFEKFK
ncbi:MAG: phenylalanine--tRNA ligase subunit beta [Candidatus Nanoarchaeia archaeon]|nr:phenylalanine--tRNA ligase subunit beta [Candidatus Nanoarchaeia archaeon]